MKSCFAVLEALGPYDVEVAYEYDPVPNNIRHHFRLLPKHGAPSPPVDFALSRADTNRMITALTPVFTYPFSSTAFTSATTGSTPGSLYMTAVPTTPVLRSPITYDITVTPSKPGGAVASIKFVLDQSQGAPEASSALGLLNLVANSR